MLLPFLSATRDTVRRHWSAHFSTNAQPDRFTDICRAYCFRWKKKKSSKVVHLQTCAANLTSHLYLSERRWAPHRSAAKSVFLPFLSNVILIPYLADMQMCEVMMCLQGFFRAVKMKCSSTCRHPSLSRLLGCVLIRIYQAQWIPVSSWCIASHLDPVRGF